MKSHQQEKQNSQPLLTEWPAIFGCGQGWPEVLGLLVTVTAQSSLTGIFVSRERAGYIWLLEGKSAR